MAIRYEDDEDRERRKRVAEAALGAARVVFKEVSAEDEPTRKRERRAASPMATVAPSEAAGKAGFDRKAYQRAYMRTYLPKWRARRRAGSNQ